MKTLTNFIHLTFALILFACIALTPSIRAVNPPPDGGYPGGNTAEGDRALLNLTGGNYNTAVGSLSLFTNRQGNFNTAVGAGALTFNRSASQNTAIGAGALLSNVSGSTSTAIGVNALGNSTTGNGNIALGSSAGSNVTTASNVICIGNAGSNSFNNACFISNIFGVSVGNGVQMYINPSGRVGAPGSSRRFKEDIKPMDDASQAILALKPVTFRYKKEIDAEFAPQFGLVAEDVEKVNPDLVVRDNEGKVYSVRYEAVNAMLLNEFLKEHRKVEALEKQIEALTAGLQKVKAQLGATKPTLQTVSR